MKFLRSLDEVEIHVTKHIVSLLAQIHKQQYLDDMQYFSRRGLILLFVIS